jgi:pimeloyl-ACP methyl ester carboxylesterase
MENKKPILHFAHANSFPAGTYRVFFDHLRKHYDVRTLELHAHNPKYPVKNGWHELTQELIDELVARYDQPVILAGHSLGGFLCLMAAKTRPDLVRCVVMMDAPIFSGWKALGWQIAKLVGTDKKISPARFSAKRLQSWANAETAYRHFASKQLFSKWSPDVLRDYVTHGLMPHANGVTLRFNREIETAVYRTIPHHIGKLIRQKFPVPIGYIGGRESAEGRMAGLEGTRRLVGKHFRQIPGGHLFPMESPAIAADALHEMIQALIHNTEN